MRRDRGSNFDFYIRPQVRFYRRDELPRLTDRLREAEAATTILPVAGEHELQLREDGKTIRGGDRYTPGAFFQLCQIMASGLANALLDVAGSRCRAKTPLQLRDGQLSREMFNEVLALRAPMLAAYRVIRDTGERTIEGFVGVRHRYLENSSLYEMVADAVGDRATFDAAALVNRRLALWYREPSPFWRATGEQQASAGYYFTNGEAAGTSVRGTLAIFLRGGVCLAPYETFGDRVNHSGKDFRRRLGAMVAKVVGNEIPRDDWRDKFAALEATGLGFADVDTDTRAARWDGWIQVLRQAGLPHGLALETMNIAIQAGAAQTVQPLTDVMAMAPRRNRFDLMVAMLRVAGRLSLARRECLELAAYSVLQGGSPT